MHRRTKVLVSAGLLASTLVLATVGGTLAQTMPMAPDAAHATCQQHGAMHDAVAQALGISTDKLYAAHAAGKTVAQLATERGIDLDTVTATVLQAHKQGLDAQVQAGRLTQEQADLLQSEPGPGMGRPGFGGKGGFGGFGGPRDHMHPDRPQNDRGTSQESDTL